MLLKYWRIRVFERFLCELITDIVNVVFTFW